MKKIKLFLIFSLYPLLGFTQGDPLNFNVAPTSPNAYAFSKYIEIPESSYTGLVPISIPIGSISEKGANVAITLSYHASGIKVDEIASWVGLGWTLNAGGVITRQERHKAERPDGNGNILPARLDIGFPETNPQTGRFDDLSILFDATRSGNFYDIEPDIFYYNFGDRSGKFVFDENGNAQFYKYEDLKIQFVKSIPSKGVSAVNSKFLVTDEIGMVYEFDEIDRAYSVELNEMIPTSWYLTKIESPQGGKITFSYTTRVAGHFYNQKTSLLIDEGDDIDNYGWPAPVPHWGTNYEVFLKSISTSISGRIEFKVDSSPRLDYRSNLPGYALKEISFYDLNNVPIKHVNFKTGYFIAPAFNSNFAAHGSPTLTSFEHLRYRLKLEAISFVSGDKSESQPPYKFEYYSDVNASLYNLPYRLSVDQDHWGYFNDARNRTLIPKITWTVSVGQWFEMILNLHDYSTNNFKGGADREGSATAVKACALHKVSYPTGGYTVYNLESNDFDDPEEGYRIGGGLRVRSIVNYDDNNLISNQKTYIYKDFDPSMNPPYLSGNSSSGHLISDPRDFYVLLGRRYGFHENSIPPGDLAPIFGDWSNVKFTHPFKNVTKISTVPQAILGSTHGQAVGYGKVIEYEKGNGYKVNTYTTSSTYPNMWNPQDRTDIDAPMDIFNCQYSTLLAPAPGFIGGHVKSIIGDIVGNQFPFLPMYDTDWKRGHLESVHIYNESKQLLYTKYFEYFFPNQTHVFGYKVYQISSNNTRLSYIHGKYYLPANWVAQKKETITKYDMNGSSSLVTVKDFKYTSSHHKFLTLEKSIDSKGSEIQKKYYYPQEYDNGVENFSTLKNKHIIGKAVKTETITENNLTDGIIIKYNNQGEPSQVYKYENASLVPPSTHNPNLLTTNNFQKKASYVYDPTTHILKDVIVAENPYSSYIWNDDYRFPIAKAENANSASIAHTSFETSEKGGWNYSGTPVPSINSKTGRRYYNLGTGSISKSGIGATNSNKFRLSFWVRRSSGSGNWTFMGQTERLSTQWKLIERDITNRTVTISGSDIIHVDELRLHPVSAQMTTYTYDFLGGMQTMTDARNYTVYYDYDTFGRLKTIKDENGQIKEHYEYNYQLNGLNP